MMPPLYVAYSTNNILDLLLIYIYRTELKDKRTELSLCCCYSEFHALCDRHTA